MATEPGRYLRKARESLASAEADIEAGRFSSAANRAYYACFQAAVAALIHAGVASRSRSWEHRFTASTFSGVLIRRRKAYSSELRDVLRRNFQVRIKADYRTEDVSRSIAVRCQKRAARFVVAVADKLEEKRIGEAPAEYGEGTMTTATKSPEACVEQVREAILEAYPDVEIDVIQQGPRDFTLEVLGDYEDMWVVSDHVSDLQGDLLDDHDVWILVLPSRRNDLDD